MTMPIGLVLLFLMAVAPVLPWRKASGELLRERLLWPAWIGAGAVVRRAWRSAPAGLAPLLAFGLGRVRGRLGAAPDRAGHPPPGLAGPGRPGQRRHDRAPRRGDHRRGVRRQLELRASRASSRWPRASRPPSPATPSPTSGPSKDELPNSERTQVGRPASTAPARGSRRSTKFGSANSLIGTPSVRTSPVNDVMLTLLALPETDDDPVSIRVIVQPLVMWLWIGGGVMAFGTLLAAIPSRIWRRPTDPVSARLPDLGHRRRRVRRRRARRAIGPRRRSPRRPDAAARSADPGADEPVDGGLVSAAGRRRRHRERPAGPVEPPSGGSHLARNIAIGVGVVLVLFIGLLATRSPSEDRFGANPLVGRAVPRGRGHDPRRLDLRHRLAARQVGRGQLLRHLVHAVRRRAPRAGALQRGARRGRRRRVVLSVAFEDEPEQLRDFFDEERRRLAGRRGRRRPHGPRVRGHRRARVLRGRRRPARWWPTSPASPPTTSTPSSIRSNKPATTAPETAREHPVAREHVATSNRSSAPSTRPLRRSWAPWIPLLASWGWS